MVSIADLEPLPAGTVLGHRLVNSKFPPISLFDDVADAEEFEVLSELQALTNPRLLTEAGELSLIPTGEIPFGIPGCSYAVAPFTHLNPDGSRFSDGSFGVLYLADTFSTAVSEVRYHQARIWQNVEGLGYERFVFRGLLCEFNEGSFLDALAVDVNDPIYDPADYTASRLFGLNLKKSGSFGIRYRSVRSDEAVCWAALTPRVVSSIHQTKHLEMVWNGTITNVNVISAFKGQSF